ncbi:MAG TPA: hypothetical protein VJ987_14455 [Anaerolineales bacterium]|nr:hypothetical protein [Anaerolineales bacterium]
MEKINVKIGGDIRHEPFGVFVYGYLALQTKRLFNYNFTTVQL